MKKVETFTHKGWFGICPVYIAHPDTDCPDIALCEEDALHNALFTVSHYAFMAFFAVADAINPNWQPGFPLRITEKLRIPYRYEYEENE